MTQWGLDTLFNPAKRHMDEEKRRLQSTREEVGDASGGKRIDFEKGKVRIRKADADESAASEAAGDGTDAAAGRATKPARAKESRPKESRTKDRGEPSPAAIRAAQRRGRTI